MKLEQASLMNAKPDVHSIFFNKSYGKIAECVNYIAIINQYPLDCSASDKG